jgi:ThiJ/PfpI family-like
MLEGWTGKLLVGFPNRMSWLSIEISQGAPAPAKEAYANMRSEACIQSPLSWSSPDFSVESYDLLFFPGGHDKGVRQALDSTTIRKHLASFWPGTKKPGKKTVAAVCHGVLVVSETTGADGKSILHDAKTTTLPNTFESGIWWATRPLLGDYYKTYGKGSENCEEMVGLLRTPGNKC